jgi:acetolactate synthase-1/2/3 large subunit
VRLLGFPCTNTLMGLGAFPGTDPQFTGMPGMHGTFNEHGDAACDVLLAVGALRRRVIGDPQHSTAPTARSSLDIDVLDLQARQGRRADRRLRRRRARQMLKLIEARPRDPAALKAGGARSGITAQGLPALRQTSALIKPQAVIGRSTRSPRATRSSPPTSASTRRAQYYKFDKPRRWINSGGLGLMGRPPAAMGVRWSIRTRSRA